MQNSENFNNKDKKAPQKPTFKLFRDKLSGVDEGAVRQRLISFVDILLTFAASYLLGSARLFFATFPLCVALVCSSRKRLFSCAATLVLLFVTNSLPDIYIFSCISTLLLRILASFLPSAFKEESHALIPSQKGAAAPSRLNRRTNSEESFFHATKEKKSPVFEEPMYMRALISAVGGLLSGIFLLIANEFSFYSLCATLTLTLLSPASVLLIGGYFGKDRTSVPHTDDSPMGSLYPLISLCVISAVCVFSAMGKSIIGMPMAPFLAMLLTLCITSSRGVICGSIAAILTGLAFSPRYIPLLVISAILFYLISALRRGAGLAVVCAAVVVFCYYIGGSEGLVSVLPPMLLAIPIYMIADKYREIMYSPYNKNAILAGGLYFAQAVTEKNKNAAVRERLSALSETFSSLSETFHTLSDRRSRPDALGIKKICEGEFERLCESCPNRDLCKGAEYSTTLDALSAAASALHKSGCLRYEDLPKAFISRCIKREKLVDGINNSLSKATERALGADKIGFFASNYEDIDEILRDALGGDGEEYESDMASSEKILDLLYELGFRPTGAAVFGKRCKNIVIKGICADERMSAVRADKLRLAIEEIVGSRLSDPAFELSDGGSVMLMHSRATLRAHCAHGSIPRKPRGVESEPCEPLFVDPFSDSGAGDELCGDMTNAFVTSSSYFYSLVSDGMGSGGEASFVSRVSSMFIEKMLCAGNRADITVRMLNNVIRSENTGCGGECSATVDLCQIDLISGTASFLKSGAAPTYIARGGKVYKVYSRTMPIGILKEADTKISKFDTRSGDLIIMLSDGCCPDSEECPWLVEYLCSYMSKKENFYPEDGECERIKDILLKKAVENTPCGKDSDDISVSVIILE